MSTTIYEFPHMPEWLAVDRVATVASTVSPSGGQNRKTAPRVGVIHNPRSHLNKTAAAPEPHFSKGLGPNIHIAEPGDRAALPQALADFAANGIDLLAIDGGDGTVRDVLTCGHGVFGKNWPALTVLPKGKTNALAYDLGMPKAWGLDDAIAAYQMGSFVGRRPLAVTNGADLEKEQNQYPVFGFIMGAGSFTQATQAGQSAHKLGAFNGLAVASTAVWALIQCLAGSRANPWRRGAAMEIGLGPHNAPLGHSGQGDERRRQLLFVSSLETLPGKIKPFGKVQTAGLAQFKMVAIDQISRRTTALIPGIVAGIVTKNLRRRGIHQLAVSSLTLSFGESFILDGEAFPAGEYKLETGPDLQFVVP